MRNIELYCTKGHYYLVLIRTIFCSYIAETILYISLTALFFYNRLLLQYSG